MRKQISYVHNLIEVAPSPVIHPHKASHPPMLETIIEEAAPEKMEYSITRGKTIYLLPIILSLVTYMLMSRLSVV
ncbi:hypothetical protein C2S51_005201 [Perilla frutescens var. frutescens]|nr:hypothetical protein C2S51_011909 [Perilla frutescens var. frutescens]KAH6790195.1 hypothetical protein C2S51_005201 [Perilla frutescens var. frutescens]